MKESYILLILVYYERRVIMKYALSTLWGLGLIISFIFSLNTINSSNSYLSGKALMFFLGLPIGIIILILLIIKESNE